MHFTVHGVYAQTVIAKIILKAPTLLWFQLAKRKLQTISHHRPTGINEDTVCTIIDINMKLAGACTSISTE